MDPTAATRFTRIYEAHFADVLAYCARRVNRAEAEDVASEVFTVLWRKIDTVGEDAVMPWLYGTAYRAIANRWRGASRQRRLNVRLRGLPRDTSTAVETIVVRRLDDERVLQAISRLKPVDQEIVRLSAWEALPARQIAETLGYSVSAVEQRLHRAKRRLAKILAPLPQSSIAAVPFPVKEGGGP